MHKLCDFCKKSKLVFSDGPISFMYSGMTFRVFQKESLCRSCSKNKTIKLLEKHKDLFLGNRPHVRVNWAYYAIHLSDQRTGFCREINQLLLGVGVFSNDDIGNWEFVLPSCGCLYDPVDDQGRALYFVRKEDVEKLVSLLKRPRAISMVGAKIRQIAQSIKAENL